LELVARQTVEFPDNSRIALSQLIEQEMQFRPIPASAGRRLLEQPSATGAVSASDACAIVTSDRILLGKVTAQSPAARAPDLFAR
jgi:hypothetical protein